MYVIYVIYIYISCIHRTSLVAQTVKNPPAIQETWVRSLGWEDCLGKEMTTHSTLLAWRIPWTEDPGNSAWGCKESDTTETKHAPLYTYDICVSYIVVNSTVNQVLQQIKYLNTHTHTHTHTHTCVY